MALLIATSGFSTICLKIQNSTYMLNILFFHPFFQTFMMFVAQLFCYFVYRLYFKQNEETYEKEKLTFKQAFIPAFCDLVSSAMLNFSLTMLSGSVFQMLRGTSILINVIFSVTFNNKILYKVHKIGLFAMFSGILLIAISNTFKETPRDDRNTDFWGIFLLYCSLVMTAVQINYEEYAMKSYEIHPLEFVGFQGIWGFFIFGILLMIFQNFQCYPINNESLLCTVNSDKIWLLENTIFAIQQIFSRIDFILLAIIIIIFTALYNYYGLIVTKMTSSLERTVVVNCRAVFVWVFFLICPGPAHETFKFLQLLGYLLIVYGGLIFNEIIEYNLFTYLRRINQLKFKIKETKIKEGNEKDTELSLIKN